MFVFLNVFAGGNSFRRSLVNLDQCSEISPVSGPSLLYKSTLWLRHDRQLNVRETVDQIADLIVQAKRNPGVPAA